MVMAVLPKKYLSIYDVADYLNELGYEYDLNQSFDRYKLNKDIYEFVLHNQIKIVHKALTIDFTYAYIVLPEYLAKGILVEDNVVNGGGSCSLIYKHEDGSYPKKGAERISVDDYPISIDSIYIPKAELDNLFNKKTEEQLLLNIAELETELAQVKAQLKEQINKPANAEIDEGQGDTLLILGAVMDCIKEVAKPNYTQQSLINAITDKYKNTSSLTDSTLTKKFPKAKTHLKQNVTS